MNESFSFKRETKEDVRAITKREIQRLEREVEGKRFELNGILARIDAQNTKAQDLLKKDPSSEIDLGVLAALVPLQEERDRLEKFIEEKEVAIAQLRGALNNN